MLALCQVRHSHNRLCSREQVGKTLILLGKLGFYVKLLSNNSEESLSEQRCVVSHWDATYEYHSK